RAWNDYRNQLRPSPPRWTVLRVERSPVDGATDLDRTYAFVDESGNSDLDTSKKGSSGFFVVCSILVAEKDLEAAYGQAEALRKRHFQTG
nr:hypothetical protein [Tanacetum cinerariifolium]